MEYSTELPTATEVQSFSPSIFQTIFPSAENSYPQFTSNITAEGFSTTIKVFANISYPGYFSCAAFDQRNIKPQSIEKILYASRVQSTPTYFKSTATCELSHVNPSTSYDIYCFTQSLDGVIMQLSDILENAIVVRTSCSPVQRKSSFLS